jgi:AcrR family transcriptional regulator
MGDGRAAHPFSRGAYLVAGLKAKQRQDTLSRIRTSARALIAQDEDSGFTSRRIAAGAGISAGRLLQYYATLNDRRAYGDRAQRYLYRPGGL